MRAALFVLATALALQGCETHLDPVAFPVGEAGTTVFVESIGSEMSVYVFHFDDPAPAIVSAPFPDRDAELYVLHYSCSLDCLGLNEGKQTLIAAGMPLPEAKSMRASKFHAGDGSTDPWAAIDALPDPIKSLRIDVPHPVDHCLHFTTESVRVDENDNARLMLKLSDEFMLVGDNTQLYRVSRDGSVALTDPILDNVRGANGAFRAADNGIIFLLKLTGELYRGDLSEGFDKVADVPLPVGPQVAFLAGPPDGSEVYISTGKRSLIRWSMSGGVEHFEDGTSGNDDSGGLIWSNGQVIALGKTPDELLYVTDHVLSRKRIASMDALTTIAWIDGVGPVLGGERGWLYLPDGDDFIPVHSENYVFQVSHMAKVLDRILFGGYDPNFSQWDAAFGICPAQFFPGESTKRIFTIPNGVARLADIQHAQGSPIGTMVAFETITAQPSCTCH